MSFLNNLKYFTPLSGAFLAQKIGSNFGPSSYTNPYDSYDTSQGAPQAPDTSAAAYSAATGKSKFLSALFPQLTGRDSWAQDITNSYNKVNTDYGNWYESAEHQRELLEQAGYNAQYANGQLSNGYSPNSPASYQNVKSPVEDTLLNPQTYLNLALSAIGIQKGNLELQNLALQNQGIGFNNQILGARANYAEKTLGSKLDYQILRNQGLIYNQNGYTSKPGESYISEMWNGSGLKYIAPEMNSPIQTQQLKTIQTINNLQGLNRLNNLKSSEKRYYIEHVLPYAKSLMKLNLDQAQFEYQMDKKFGAWERAVGIGSDIIGSAVDIASLFSPFGAFGKGLKGRNFTKEYWDTYTGELTGLETKRYY